MNNHKPVSNAPFKTTILSVAVSLALGTAAVTTAASVQAAVLSATWTGLHTLLDPNGFALANVSLPYYYDPTWGYGFRTQVTGTMLYDTATGNGIMSIAPFQWGAGDPLTPMIFHTMSLQRIGDGNGGAGPLLDVNTLWDWNGNSNTAAELILDASGFFAAIAGGASIGQLIDQGSVAASGALPASNEIRKGVFPIGSVPIATTTYDSAFPLTGDAVGGVPMSGGVFPQFNHNLDITSLTIVDVTELPLPAAAWLFGSGLLALAGTARRKKCATVAAAWNHEIGTST
ncbi:MAG: VPLPA-CTERM sorting domain-containing protein [Pseudomonadota bacterium]